MTPDPRAQAYAWGGPGNETLVEAVYKHLVATHRHRSAPDQCSRCWLRAGLAIEAVVAVGSVALRHPGTQAAAENEPARPAPANPMTDQYLANAARDSYRHQHCPPGGCTVERLEATWRNNLLSTLPDVELAVVGKVLLHLGANVSEVMSQPALQTMPQVLPLYLSNLLQNFGADLINLNTATSADAG